eukprot:TRINITY_DN41576_c0_g1_i2.p1 TRINITY_DN41576_c0_g1~~TRINITY_DN41576_c0_g1_i2.p1  ORF type:complete len:195 (-),score=38.24 TRINITY_DN41576_c0_g1_i2:211-711(-)
MPTLPSSAAAKTAAAPGAGTPVTDVEADGVGSVHVMQKGTCNVLLVGLRQAVSAMQKEDKKNSVTKSALLSNFETMDEVHVASYGKDVEIYHGKLEANSALVVPPGFVLCEAAVNKTKCLYIRRPFHSLQSKLDINMAALLEITPASASIEVNSRISIQSTMSALP